MPERREFALNAGWTIEVYREGRYVYLDWFRTGSGDPYLPNLTIEEAEEFGRALIEASQGADT